MYVSTKEIISLRVFYSTQYSFDERLVYSFIAHCTRMGHNVSLRMIEETLPLTHRTIKRCVASLGGLVQRTSTGYYAHKPDDGVFTERTLSLIESDKCGKSSKRNRVDHNNHWSIFLAYFRFYLPPKGSMTKEMAAIWSLKRSLDKRKKQVNKTYFATVLGMDRKTVERRWDEVAKMSLPDFRHKTHQVATSAIAPEVRDKVKEIKRTLGHGPTIEDVRREEEQVRNAYLMRDKAEEDRKRKEYWAAMRRGGVAQSPIGVAQSPI